MRAWADGIEQNVYRLERARAWRRSGLLLPEQLASIEAGAGPQPAQAGWAVRLMFFGFAFVASTALVVFLTWLIDSKALQVVALLGGATASYVLGEAIQSKSGLYRFGVEEGLFAGALLQLCCALAVILDIQGLHRFADYGEILGWAAALYLAWLYARFGYLYAALGCLAALTVAVSSRLEHWAGNSVRCALTGLYAALLAASSLRRQVPDHDKQGWRVIQACLFLLICLTLNLRLERLADLNRIVAPDGGIFYWTTFAAVLLLPAAALAWGVARRHRPMLLAGGTSSVVAIVSIKPYLGLPRHSWDPAVLGTAMMLLSILLKRWLDSGIAGQRNGFTARPILVGRDDGPGLSSLLAAAVAAPAAPASLPAEKGFSGHGGSAGGAGASGGF